MKKAGIVMSLLVATLVLPLANSFAVISSPPTNLVVQSISKTQINLSWTAPFNSTQNLVNGYKIERDSGCISKFFAISINHTSTGFIDSGLAPGKCYAYRIYALNPSGISNPSNTAKAVTMSGPFTNQTKTMDNLGQKVSDFVHKRNELLKKQREETLKIVKQCREKTVNATGTARKQIKDDCQDLRQEIKVKYNDQRDDIKKEFKTFKNEAKILLKSTKTPTIQNQTKQVIEPKKEIKGMGKNPKK